MNINLEVKKLEAVFCGDKAYQYTYKNKSFQFIPFINSRGENIGYLAYTGEKLNESNLTDRISEAVVLKSPSGYQRNLELLPLSPIHEFDVDTAAAKLIEANLTNETDKTYLPIC